MKRIARLLLAGMMMTSLAVSAQSYTSYPRPGVSVNTTPYGTSVGVSTPYFNYTYTTDGYYDNYGRFHRTSHRHGHNIKHCKYCEKQMKKHQKEMRKMQKEAHKHHKDAHHHH